MSLQCQCVIDLHRDENPTKTRCRYNTVCPASKQNSKSCNSKAAFLVFEQVIISTGNCQLELFSLEKGNITIKKTNNK